MPRIKVERILSVSSEDAKHPAENILNMDTKKKWKCKDPGDPKCMVVLQLPELVKIVGIDIGNEHSAFVEVLVGRMGFNDDDYKQLLMTSSFMTPKGSAQSDDPNRIRMFNSTDFCQDVAEERWDRVKIVCIQPFNRKVQYGLSFVIIHVPAPKEKPPTLSSITKIGNFAIRSENADDIPVGSAFNKVKQQPNVTSGSSNVFNDLSDCSDVDPDYKPDSSDEEVAFQMRQASLPSYIEEHGAPKITRHKLNTSQTSSNNKTPTHQPSKNMNQLFYEDEDDIPTKKTDKLKKIYENKKKEIKSEENPSSSQRKTPVKRKSFDTDKNIQVKRQKKIKTLPFKELMKDVVFVMSGYQNPSRATIRSRALQMGAKYKPDWGDGCTHLICAFRNTPKYNDVFGLGKITSAEWINECYKQKKRLSWRSFALDRDDKNGDISEEEIIAEEIAPKDDTPIPSTSTKPVLSDSGEDTEDEIEKIRKNQTSKTSVNKFVLSDSDNEDNLSNKNNPNEKDPKKNEVPEVKSIFDQDTDVEDVLDDIKEVKIKPLPRFFDGKLFYLADHLIESEITLLKRYISAYAGSVTQNQEEADIIIGNTGDGLRKSGKILHPAWIWECHDSESLLPDDKFLIKTENSNSVVSDE